MGFLPPGSPRRWIPEGGLQKYRERIHRESKFADDYKKLPFTFSKPQVDKKYKYFECVECGKVFTGSRNMVMCVCPVCKKVVKVKRCD